MIKTMLSDITGAAEVETDLGLKRLADTLPQLVWVTLPDGYHEFYNNRWFDYTGLSWHETKGDGWNSVLHPDDQQRAMDVWSHSLKTGADYEIEYRLRRHDGIYQWFLGRALPLRDESGAISKWFGTCTDIHQQKLLSQQLADSQAETARLAGEMAGSHERFQIISKATHDAVWDRNLDSNDIWWNEGFRELFGEDEEHIPTVGSWYDRVHPDDRPRVEESIRQVIEGGGENWDAEYRIRRKDGSYACVYDRGYVLHDADGRPYRMLGSMQDISARKHAEATLAESEKRFRTLALNSPDLITRHGKDFRYLYASPIIEQLTGIRPEAFIGKSYYELDIPQYLCPVFDKALSTVFRTQMPHQMEYSVAGDREIFVHSRLIPEFGESGELESVLIISTDVTEQRKLEQLLEQRVKERTRELELRNQELEHFTYASHHDLKEPVRKIMIFTEMVRSSNTDVLSTESQSLLERISRSAGQMADDLKYVLNYASLERQEDKEAVDLNTVLATVLSDLEISIRETGAEIRSDRLPVLTAVPRQMHQLLYNLLNNAIKFSVRGHAPEISIQSRPAPACELKCHPDADPGKRYVHISISDAGIGFDPDFRERIFLLFQRLQTKDAYPGTGIGLALCRKVVMNHGGSIRAESAPGAGATFHILLPE